MSVQTPATVDLSKYIDTKFFGERPHIRGRRVPVVVIAFAARARTMTIPELAHDYTLSEAQILAALLYYEEHREQIDAQEAREAAFFNEAYEKQHGRKD